MINTNNYHRTNGDVFKTTYFGSAKIKEYSFATDIEVWDNDMLIAKFDKKWWNSPYRFSKKG